MAIPKEISSRMKSVRGWATSSDEVERRLYTKWHGMFKRCYNPRSLVDNASYIGCTVYDLWFDMSVWLHDIINLPNFPEAYADKFEGWSLDKDSRVVGNKEYGPDTCVFLRVEDNSSESLRRNGLLMSKEVRDRVAHSEARAVVGIAPCGKVFEWFGAMEAGRYFNIASSSIQQACNCGCFCNGVWTTKPHTKSRGKLKGWTFYWKDEYVNI